MTDAPFARAYCTEIRYKCDGRHMKRGGFLTGKMSKTTPGTDNSNPVAYLDICIKHGLYAASQK